QTVARSAALGGSRSAFGRARVGNRVGPARERHAHGLPFVAAAAGRVPQADRDGVARLGRLVVVGEAFGAGAALLVDGGEHAAAAGLDLRVEADDASRGV